MFARAMKSMAANKLRYVLLSCALGGIPLEMGGRTPNIFVCDVVLAVLAIGLLIIKPLCRGTAIRYPRILHIYLLYLIVSFGTMLLSDDVLLALANWKLRFMPLLVLLIAYSALQSYGDIEFALDWTVIAATLIAVIMLVNWNQYFTGSIEYDLDKGMKDMASSDIGRSNYLASIFILTLPLALNRIRIAKRKLVPLVCSGVLFTSVILTMSRGALLSLLLSAFVWFLLSLFYAHRAKEARIILIMLAGSVCFCAAAWLMIPADVSAAFGVKFDNLFDQYHDDPESISRYAKILAGMDSVSAHPLLGIGIGNQGTIYGGGTAHNFLLEALIETGIAGFVLLTAFLSACLAALLREWKQAADESKSVVAGAIVFSCLTALINALIEPSLWAPQYACFFWTVIAGGLAQRKIAAAEEEKGCPTSPLSS